MKKKESSAATKKTAAGPISIPPHSLIAFGLFLRLPGYAEQLIKQRTRAKSLLRLVLGVRDDGEGNPILATSLATSLPTLPFTNLRVRQRDTLYNKILCNIVCSVLQTRSASKASIALCY